MTRKKKTLPEELAAAVKIVEEYTGFNIPKQVAKRTRQSYQGAIAAATLLPLTLGNVGPVPIIATQQPVKRPDEHLPSQAPKAVKTTINSDFLMSATATEGSRNFAIIKDGKKMHYTTKPKPKK